MSPRTDLNQLVVLCLEAFEEGRPQVLDELCLEHPEHATRLRSRLAALREAGLVGGTASGEEFPERLGEFELVERLGAGGMGVVYLADQPSLGRRVALKLIRPDQLFFEGARERFQREVEAVARLSHPGIVPVHAVGEEGGIPWFAMEFVDGVGLDRVLEALRGRELEELDGRLLLETVVSLSRGDGLVRADDPLFRGDWSQACLWIAREVAQALEHAHQRGILHRDLKPSNIMITSSGRVLLMDFGLASGGEGPRVTRTGSQVGSLPYMAPEQVEGRTQDQDVRTDVYGLGATLYELLARKAAYGDTSAIDLQSHILSAAAPRLRQLDAGLSRDVEAIVAVAMEPSPARRYASAADLARDLTQALDGRPVEARPAGPWLQLGRWSRRNPGAATAVALALVLAIGVPLLFGVQQSRAVETQRRLTAQVEAQRARADARLAQAVRAVDEMLTRVALVQLEHVPQLELVRVELLAAAQGMYEELGGEADDSPAVREQRLRVGTSLADLALDLFRGDDARSAIDGAASDLELLRAADPELPGLAGVEIDLALLRGRLALLEERPADALSEFEAAIEITRASPEGEPLALATLLHDRSVALKTLGRSAQALDSSLEAVETVALARSAQADSRELAQLHVESLSHLGVLHTAAGEPDTGVERQREALEITESWLERAPEDSAMRLKLLTACANLCSSARLAGRGAEGLEFAAQGVEHGEWFTARFPADMFALRTHATLELNRALLLWEAARADEALQAFDGALVGFERLARTQPGAADPNLRVASVLGNRGGLRQELGQLDEALVDLDRAIELHVELRTGGMGDPEFVLQLAVAHGNRALVHMSAGRHAEALLDLRGALPHFRVAAPIWNELALQCNQAAQLAIEDPALEADELDELVEGFCEVALSALERAQTAGVLASERLRDSDTWELLSGRERFESLIE